MSVITREDQLVFVRAELKTREESYPLRIQMGRMTTKDAERSLAIMRAIIKTLDTAIILPLKTEDNPITQTAAEKRFLKIAPTINEIHICAGKNKRHCVHCRSINDVLDSLFGFTSEIDLT